MLKEMTVKIHCDICGKKVPREKACQVTLIFGAYTPGKEGKNVKRNEVCEVCAQTLENLMTCPPKEEKQATAPKPKKRHTEGRCITVARVRAGMTQDLLGEKIYYNGNTVSTWEQGKNKPNWELLYNALPELPEIREKGCAAYCEKPTYCQNGDGSCYYSKGYCAKGKKQKEPNAG